MKDVNGTTVAGIGPNMHSSQKIAQNLEGSPFLEYMAKGPDPGREGIVETLFHFWP